MGRFLQQLLELSGRPYGQQLRHDVPHAVFDADVKIENTVNVVPHFHEFEGLVIFYFLQNQVADMVLFNIRLNIEYDFLDVDDVGWNFVEWNPQTPAVGFWGWSLNRNDLAPFYDVVWKKRHCFGKQDKFDTAQLHVTVENVQQLVVDEVKIFTNNDTIVGVVFTLNDVHYVVVNVIPQRFRVAPQQVHVHFIVDVANLKIILLVVQVNVFDVFQVVEAIFFNEPEGLGILADAGRAIENQVTKVCKKGG